MLPGVDGLEEKVVMTISLLVTCVGTAQVAFEVIVTVILDPAGSEFAL
jgi:hypothetical protein